MGGLIFFLWGDAGMSSTNQIPERSAYLRYFMRAIRLVRHGKSVAATAAGILVSGTLLTAVFDQTTIIDEFEVPGGDPGIKRHVADLLYKRISDIQAGAQAAVADQRLGVLAIDARDPLKKITNLKVIGTEVPLTPFIDQLRSVVGLKATRISGALVETKDPKGVKLSARVSGSQRAFAEATGSTLKEAVEELGDRLAEILDPLMAGFYYIHEGTNLDKVLGVAEHYPPTGRGEAVWWLVLRGMALRDQTGQEQDTRKYLCKAIDLEPSFIPAWRILGNSLRADGAFEKAEYLARRLVYMRPEEPEGFRQLGNLRSNCATGADQESQARRFFERAIVLGRNRPVENPDYLSLVDYGKWLYEHYQPNKPYLPVNSEADLSVKRDYIDAAADKFEEAERLALGAKKGKQESIYTNWARVLGYPRSDLSQSVKMVRYAMAERTVKQALDLPSHRPFANFVMGELLTDKAVEAHRYKSEKAEIFQKAQAALEYPVSAAKWGEAQYDAMYARALAGQGKYNQAIKLLSKYQNPKSSNFFLVKWIRGEVFYNYSLEKQDRSLLEAASKQLQDARNLRACGPRSEIIRDLLRVVETELEKNNTPKEPGLEISQDGAEPLIEKRTGYPAATPHPEPLAKPDPKQEPGADTAKPERGAKRLGPEIPQLQLAAIQPGEPAAKLVPPVITEGASPPKSDGALSPTAIAPNPAPVPPCNGWPLLPEEEPLPGPPVEGKTEAFLSAFHSAH
jgi:hypothetical protein